VFLGDITGRNVDFAKRTTIDGGTLLVLKHIYNNMSLFRSHCEV